MARKKPSINQSSPPVDESRIIELVDNVKNAVSVGLDFDRALLVCGVRIHEMELVRNHEYMREFLAIADIQLELDALKQHSRARTIAANKGNAAPAQWFLSKINPKRWGDGTDNGAGPRLERPLEELSDSELRQMAAM